MSQLKQNFSRFSRGALKMTFTILRSSSPDIALEVRNITGNSEDNAKLFEVNMKLSRVEELIDAFDHELERISSPGMIMIAKSLRNDWDLFRQELKES